MNLLSVGFISAFERMKILETVTGSNQRLTQPHTVGKKDGAPMICALSAICKSQAMAGDLQICGPKSLGNALLPIHWHLAYVPSDSRTE